MPNIGTWSLDDVEQEMQGYLHGTTLNQITNLLGVFNRAARRVVLLVDPQETTIVAQFGKVYQGVFDYGCPIDLKGNRVIDFYPQANRQLTDTYGQQYNKEFDLWKQYTDYTSFTPRYESGQRILRINAVNLLQGVQINDAAAVNDNGLWVASANVSNLATSNLYYTDGVSSSVQFSLNQTGIQSVATIYNKTFTAVNLQQNYLDNDDEFFQIYLPNAAGIVSIDYQFGTDLNDYYDSGAITTTALGTSFQNGWNLIKVPWPSTTSHGNPNPASIGSIQLSITYNGTQQNGVCINQFYSRTGVIFNIEYYSKFLFRDATTGVFQEKATDSSNIVNLDTDGIPMFIWAAFAIAVQQQAGLDAMFADGPGAESQFQEALAAYKAKYKGQTTKPQSSYYPNRQQSYRRYFGYGRLPRS
jgi:hypothetical protein